MTFLDNNSKFCLYQKNIPYYYKLHAQNFILSIAFISEFKISNDINKEIYEAVKQKTAIKKSINS